MNNNNNNNNEKILDETFVNTYFYIWFFLGFVSIVLIVLKLLANPSDWRTFGYSSSSNRPFRLNQVIFFVCCVYLVGGILLLAAGVTPSFE